MPITNHTLTLLVNGIDRTNLLQKDSLYARSSISNDGDVAQFTMRDNGTYSPQGWDSVHISVNGDNVFGGYIVRKNAADVGVGSNHKRAHWQVECRDWSVLLDQVTVNYGYSDSDDTAIIADLFSRYLPGDGFDAVTEVANVKDDIDIYFENITIREALDHLGGICGADWHIGPDKDVYWYATATPANAAFDIDTVSPNDSTTFDVLAKSISVAVDETTIINRVNVVGGERLVGLESDTFAGDGVNFHFGLSQKLSSVDFVSYVIGGITHYARSQDVGFEPEDALRYNGGTVDVLINLENRYVAIKDAAGNVPDALTDVVASYYYTETVVTTVESTGSQGEYGRIFDYNVYDEELTSVALATDYAQRVIDEYAFGRQSITFGVTRHGLLPGRLISINVPVLEVEDTTSDRLESMDGYFLLLENDDLILLESDGSPQRFIIQDVEIRPIVSDEGDFLIIARVTCGKYIPSLFDSLKKIKLSASTGLLPAKRNVGKLDTISNDLGEIRGGRAVFTDGGTALFSWENYADHTGAVLGLEGSGSDVQGALYILQDGIVRAKVGKMDGLGSVGTIAPSGWGIWTSNGYFQGAIAANSGNIGGWTIASNAIYANGGTISTGVPPINSSNPGVYMNAGGIFGYGTLGLTFSLPSDPAQRPIFSSGTILETVYEVTNASVIRTGTLFPKVQIDNTGIFAWDSGTALKFSVATSSGVMTAVDGVFSGSVTASQIAGGTITGGRINGGTVTGGVISGGTVTGAVFTGGTVTQGTISAATISGGTVTGAVFTGGTVTQGTISAATISGGTVTGAVFTGGTVTQGTISAASISGGTITGGSISGGTISGALVTGGTVSALGGSVSISNTLGLNFVCPTSAPGFDDLRFVRWRNASTDAMAAQIGAQSTSTNNYLFIHSGTAGTINSDIYLRAHGTAGGTTGDYSELGIKNDEFYFSIIEDSIDYTPLRISNAQITAGENFLPDSSGGRYLGAGTAGWRGLYLHGDNGSKYLIYVNSSGVLTTSLVL